MIAIEVDFNHADGRGRLLLADLVSHERTPFLELAASGERILFIDGDECVEGELVHDPHRGWVGAVDWDSQGTIRAFPANLLGRTRAATGRDVPEWKGMARTAARIELVMAVLAFVIVMFLYVAAPGPMGAHHSETPYVAFFLAIFGFGFAWMLRIYRDAART